MKQNECPICRHIERSLIDYAIAEGRPDSYLASHFAADADSVQWHKENCLGVDDGDSAGQQQGGLDAEELRASHQNRLQEMREAAWKIAAKAGDDAGQWRMALSAINAASRLVAQEARLAERKKAPRQRLAESPEWQRLKARILKALEPYPEARRALMEALQHDA